MAKVPAAALREVIEFTFTDGDAGRMSREEMLLHVVSHGAYHRGNIGQVLRRSRLPRRATCTRKFLHGLASFAVLALPGVVLATVAARFRRAPDQGAA